MQFRLSMDELISELETHQLGRLLIAFQVMEEAVRLNFPRVVGLSDRFGVIDSLASGWTAGRKAEEALKVLDTIIRSFELPPAAAAWEFKTTFGADTTENDTLAAAEALATARDFWQRAKAHLDYRNQLFHGRLHEKEGTLIIQTKGSPIPFTAQGFAEKRNDVLGVVVGLYMATTSAMPAVKWLCHGQSIQAGTES